MSQKKKAILRRWIEAKEREDGVPPNTPDGQCFMGEILPHLDDRAPSVKELEKELKEEKRQAVKKVPYYKRGPSKPEKDHWWNKM